MEEALSRKEMLAAWRAAKGKPAQANKTATTGGGEPAAGRKGKGGVAEGVLQARPDAGNRVHKRTAPSQRKPFQVDTKRIQEASERRVQPGTPLHSLKKRLKHTAAAAKAAPIPSAGAAAAAAAATTTFSGAAKQERASASIPTARAQGKAKAAAAARVPGYVSAVSRSLDAARTKEVSDYLKTQISEANMLLEISGVDAARTLLADLLSCTGAARGVGELALYWAARSKLEEDTGMYVEARQLLDQGEAYLSMPTQQKVMTKVMTSFEGRMNERASVEVDRLLEDSVDGLSLNDSASNSNSPASSAPFRYDPNDQSTEDDPGSGRSATKILNFSKIARESSAGSGRGGNASPPSSNSSSGSRTSITTRCGISPDWMKDPAEESHPSSSGAASGDSSSGSGDSGAGGGVGNGSGVASMSGVIYSDDESVSDIDEGVIARAEAFHAEEEARNARIEAEEAGRVAGNGDDGDGCDTVDVVTTSTDVVHDVAEAAYLDPARHAKDDYKISGSGSGSGSGSDRPRRRSSTIEGGPSISASTHTTMAPPPPPPTTMAVDGATETVPSGKRKGTPHPKPKPNPKPKPTAKRNTPGRSLSLSSSSATERNQDQELSPASFIAQVEAKGKDGKRILTPVRRSRRISGVSREPTPALLRKEMEAML